MDEKVIEKVSAIVAYKFKDQIATVTSDIDLDDLKQEITLFLLEHVSEDTPEYGMISIAYNKAIDIYRYYARRAQEHAFKTKIEDFKDKNESSDGKYHVYRFKDPQKVAELCEFLDTLADREFVYAMSCCIDNKLIDTENFSDQFIRLENIAHMNIDELFETRYSTWLGLSVYSGTLTGIKKRVKEAFKSFRDGTYNSKIMYSK